MYKQWDKQSNRFYVNDQGTVSKLGNHLLLLLGGQGQAREPSVFVNQWPCEERGCHFVFIEWVVVDK